MNQQRPLKSVTYDEDFYAWTQQQAKLLRAAGKLGAELPSGLDLPHLAEEIEDLGKSELRGASNLIKNVLVHLIKAASDPDAEAVSHWREEVLTFLDDLPEYYTPSMRRLIDMDKLWSQARRRAEGALERQGRALGPRIPNRCPLSLSDLLIEDFRFDDAVDRLRGESTGAP